MSAPRDDERMARVLDLIERQGVVSTAAIARALGEPYGATNQWLLRNGLDLPMRRSMAPTIDPYTELAKAVAAAGSKKAWARSVGVHRQDVVAVLRGRKHISPALLQALGLRPVVTYERAPSPPSRISPHV